jgi:hypothetical protein
MDQVKAEVRARCFVRQSEVEPRLHIVYASFADLFDEQGDKVIPFRVWAEQAPIDAERCMGKALAIHIAKQIESPNCTPAWLRDLPALMKKRVTA